MKRLDQNQEKWLSLSAFKQDPRKSGRSVLREPGRTAQSCHRRSSRLFFGSNLLSEISKRLSGNDAPEMMGLLPGNLDALVGGRFRSARPRWSSENIENNIEGLGPLAALNAGSVTGLAAVPKVSLKRPGCSAVAALGPIGGTQPL